MADALPPRLLVERPSEAGFVKRTEDAGPRQKLARGTIVDKPSLKLKGIVARYDPAHDGYIVLAADGSTFHVRPDKVDSYTVVENAGDVSKLLDKALDEWERNGATYDWSTHRWDETEDHPSLAAVVTPELSKQLMEIALLRQGYGLVSRLLSFQPAPPLPHLHLAARSLDPKMITLVLSKGIDVDETGGEEWNGNSPLGVLASLCACEASGYSKCRGYHRKEELFAAGDNEAEVEEEYMGAAHNGTNGTYATSPLGSSFGRGGSGSFNSFYSGRSPIPGELTPSDALVACAELLISRGASIDHRNISGEPILFLALGSHNDLLAHMLLQKGAWYEIPGKMGNPFHIAAGCFSMEHTRDFVFEKLEAADESQRKAWLEMKDVNGYLPIHYAAQAGDASLVERMVGWDPELLDTPTVDGETALCIAAHYGHHGTVDGLLKLGADPSKKDSRGIGPIEAAGAMGHCRASLILHRVAPLAERDKDVPPVLMCQNLVGGCTVLLAQDSDRDCRRCGLKRYCSVECAKEDWAAGHRLRCPRTKGGRGRSASMVSFIG